MRASQQSKFRRSISLIAFITFAASTSASAQVGGVSVIAGNHPIAAETETPGGPRAADTPLAMAVTLKLRDPAGANTLLTELQNPASPDYHQWLTPAEFAAQFGPTQADIDTVVSWLQSQGFTVTSVNAGQRLIEFSGTVAQAQSAFRTTIYNFGSGSVFGNIQDPMIPAQLAGVVAQVHGLDNMTAPHPTTHLIPRAARPHASLVAHPKVASAHPAKVYASLTRGDSASDALPATAPDGSIGGINAFAPADFASFFDSTPLLTGNVNGGGGDCIAIVGDSDYEHTSLDTFNSSFNQAASVVTTMVVNGKDPGFNLDEEEALLDLEWSHAVAPGAATFFYVSDSSAPVISPIVDEISQAVSDDTCGVISVSFSLCGGSKSFFTNTVSPIYTQAALQGQSIFISSGDQGSAGLTFNSKFGCVTGTTRNVNQLAADPNVTAVGGASFTPSFDASGNNLSVVTSTPLRVWNDPHDGKAAGGASGGGASSDYAKPSYQYGLGVPADNKRDLPDVSLIASPYFPGAFAYIDGSCFTGNCNGAGTPTPAVFGGTSLAAPTWAGIAKLVAQGNGVVRLGSANPRLYQLANSTIHASIFQDVTSGNNGFNKVAGYSAGAGFNLSTGWGPVDIDALETNYFATVTPLGPQVIGLSPASLAFGNVNFATAGAASKVRTLTITNPKKYEATLQIDSIVGSTGFSADPACNNVAIAPGGKLVCHITYVPTAFGAASGSLTINSNASTSPQVVGTSGNGILGRITLAPGTLNFGKVAVNTASAAKTVTLTNRTGATFTIASISNANPAFVASQSCVGALGASGCAISVTFTPTSTPRTTDTLTITDSADGFSRTVNLIGTGE